MKEADGESAHVWFRLQVVPPAVQPPVREGRSSVTWVGVGAGDDTFGAIAALTTGTVGASQARAPAVLVMRAVDCVLTTPY